ncbi:rhamnogalacturonan acetylesterase [Flavobacterium agrisoli]|uniref:Rhamnogalacturonan acetylesterase n=1 Tax=Flavobacterium agrisoli TaxID=2793066 RepID=A0A934PNF3_9FLAO|nr:rhamnogalacturonan acetylesterase [Flavobacterium agrisoli]MBK0370747.1 rhamnogalacturonan acetylesterase [Flavobacterium agrisoli]
MKIQLASLLLLLSVAVSAQKTTIYGIGDSTMANKKDPEKNPEHGWGQVLQPYLKDNLIFENKAINGRSTRSFINEKKWDEVYQKLKKGDYVFIEFGHNDQKIKDSARYTNPHTAYRYNLIKFVTEARSKGAIPILFTSIVRRDFNENGVLVDSHGEYPLEVRLVAQQYNVPFVDMQYHTELLEQKYGPEGSKKLHLHYKAGENPYYTSDKDDDTHLSELGANEVAKIALQQIKLLQNPELKLLQAGIK